jgi:alginate O-acetyltransferase complex protein AlgJ
MPGTPKAPVFDRSFVHEGRDGWLFLIGGSNSVSSLYDREHGLTPDRVLQCWADLIEKRAQRLARLGIQYVHINVPEKLTIYDEKLWGPPIVDWTLSPAVRLRDMVRHLPHGGVWLDLIEPFRNAPNKDQLYFRTDTHWSGEGCYLAYRLICERIGLTPDADLLSRSHRALDGILDMGNKMDPPVYEPVKFYDFVLKSKRVWRNAIAQYLEDPAFAASIHVGTHVRYANTSPSAQKKKILIFGDSFSSQRGDALTAMLAETAQEVEFVWSSNLDWAYIERAKPDVVIYELTERFMTILATDRLSLRWMTARQILKAQRLRLKARIRAALQPRAA